MKQYTAILASGNRITTVLAENKKRAVQQIETALDRPGRRHLLRQWKEHGKQVIEK